MDLRQRTVADEINCTGIGLHSGRKAKLTIKPAPPNSGITFERLDISPNGSVKASFDNVVATNMATTIVIPPSMKRQNAKNTLHIFTSPVSLLGKIRHRPKDKC